MTTAIEQNLIKWQTNNRDTGDDLHRHFAAYGRWDWCEIYREGIRIHNLMFAETIEDFTPKGDILAAVAAQAKRGTFARIAACLGVDGEALELAVAEWSEEQENLPPPISTEQLMQLCAEQTKWLREFHNAKSGPSEPTTA